MYTEFDLTGYSRLDDIDLNDPEGEEEELNGGKGTESVVRKIYTVVVCKHIIVF